MDAGTFRGRIGACRSLSRTTAGFPKLEVVGPRAAELVPVGGFLTLMPFAPAALFALTVGL